MSGEHLDIAEMRRLHAGMPDTCGKLVNLVMHRLTALLDAAEERDGLQAKLDSANGSLDALRNAINDYDGVDRGREVKIPVGRVIGIVADLRADKRALESKLAALVAFNEKLLGRERKEVYPDCNFCRDSGHGHECPGPIPNTRWAELHDAIAAAKEPQP